jgi:hypothetical protein
LIALVKILKFGEPLQIVWGIPSQVWEDNSQKGVTTRTHTLPLGLGDCIPRKGMHRMKSRVDYDLAIAMLEHGTTRKEIAEYFSVHRGTLDEGLRNRGIPDGNHVGYVTTWNGYIKLKRPEHGRADKRGYVPEHTLVMEDNLGRLLEDGEIAHHIDGNRNNNLISNLQVMDKEEHRSFHSKGNHYRRDSVQDIV